MDYKAAKIIVDEQDKMIVRLYKTDKPTLKKVGNEVDGDFGKVFLERDLNDWELSADKFETHPKQKSKFIDLAQYNYIGNLGHLHESYDKDIKEGIEVPVKRIGLKHFVDYGKPNSPEVEIISTTPRMMFSKVKAVSDGYEWETMTNRISTYAVLTEEIKEKEKENIKSDNNNSPLDILYNELKERLKYLEEGKQNNFTDAKINEVSLCIVRVQQLLLEQIGKPEVRPAVKWFAEQMEAKLKANDHKGGWKDCDIKWLYGRLKEETKEFEQLFNERMWSKQGRSASENVSLYDTSNEALIKELADIGNFAMMLSDQFGKNYGK